MQIWIKNIKGQHFPLAISPIDNGKTIRQKIRKTVTDPKTNISMFYDCEVITLQDNVSSLGIRTNHVITIFGQPNPYIQLNLLKKEQEVKIKEIKKVQKKEEKAQQIVIDQDILNALVSSGYTKQQSTQALIEAKGNGQKAMQILSNQKKSQPPAKSALRLLFQAGKLSWLITLCATSPGCLQILLAATPSQANRQLFKTISEHRDEFQQLVRQTNLQQLIKLKPPNSTILPTIPLASQLNPADRAAIDRLMDLGFPESGVIIAYFNNNKDQQEAADYLLEEAENLNNQHSQGSDN